METQNNSTFRAQVVYLAGEEEAAGGAGAGDGESVEMNMLFATLKSPERSIEKLARCYDREV